MALGFPAMPPGLEATSSAFHLESSDVITQPHYSPCFPPSCLYHQSNGKSPELNFTLDFKDSFFFKYASYSHTPLCITRFLFAFQMYSVAEAS